MRTILVGADGSAPSVKAARMALTIAERFDAKLVFLHASPPLVFPAALPPENLRSAQESEAKAAQDSVEGVVADAAKAAVKSEFVALYDIPAAEALVEAAQRLDAWLVVVGDTGRHGLARVFLGSVADRVVHFCHRPVLVVK